MMKILILALLLIEMLALKGNQLVFTQVACLYDIGRGLIGFQTRSYHIYLEYFSRLLGTQSNLIIFGDEFTEEFVWRRRKPYNTVFIRKSLEEVKSIWFFPHVGRINQMFKNEPQRINIQFKINQYLAIVLSKLYLLDEAMRYDKFNTDMVMWIDGGIFHVLPEQYAKTEERYIENIIKFTMPSWVLYTFDFKNVQLKNMSKFISKEPGNRTSGGYYGGYAQAVGDVKNAFQNLLRILLENDEMDSQEIVFDLMTVKFPYLIPAVATKFYKDFYKRYYFHSPNNRKVQVIREFKGNFMDQKLFVEQNFKYLDRKPQPGYFVGLNRQVNILNSQNAFYKVVLHRIICFFSVLTIFYAYIFYMNPYNYRNSGDNQVTS